MDGDPVSTPLPVRLAPFATAVSVMLVGFMLVYVMVMFHQSDTEKTSVEARNLSATIGQEVSRNLELYGLSIQGAVEGAANPEIMGMSKEIRQLILFDRAASASDLGKLMVIDEHGLPIADSTAINPQAINYFDREYFTVQRDNPGYGLYVSAPIVSRSTGHRIVAFSRRYDKPDGSFGGVVVGTVHLDYFRKIFNQVHLPAGTNITLYRDDGTVLMREPFNSSVGKRVSVPQMFDHLGDVTDGEYQDPKPADGVDRLFHFRHVGAFPLALNVGVSTMEVDAKWRQYVLIMASAFVILLMIAVSGLLLMNRETKSRVRTEIALRQLNNADALTGLANRRCLDRTLEQEWSRAMRQSQPLSFLMIDADFFKKYNDSLGHGAGDDALRSLGQCIKAAARRPGDLAARYGGEEFSLLLPNTDAPGAMAVAKTLRDKLAALDIHHPESPIGHFTVSVGIATMVPRGGRSPGTLVALADGALYKSKKEGRDRATAHVEGPVDLRVAA